MNDIVIIHTGFSLRGEATIGKRKYRWDFSPVSGPLFYRADGKPLKIQPGENHSIWPAFELWREKHQLYKE